MTRRVALLITALSPLVGWSGLASSQVDDRFDALFNGRDLSGWHNINCAPDTFTAKDGEIVSTGKPICEIRTARMYENFVLELEYQHMKPGGNAGVFIWADALPARGEPFLRAIEVQVLDGQESADYTSHGDVFAIHGAVMTPDRPHPKGWMRSLPAERRAKPAGQWNHYRITANNGAITLAVNGKEVSGGHDISPRKGYIALESEGAPTRFRHIRIRELPASGTLAPAQIAQTDEGFTALYNGLDTTGWIQRDRAVRWRADDWTLKAIGPGPIVSGDLVSAKTYGQFVLMADWRVSTTAASRMTPSSGTAPSSVASGPAPHAGARFVLTPRVTPEAPAGAWHRTVATVRDGLVMLTVDGRTVVDNPGARGVQAQGSIVLTHAGDGVEYANIFLKTIPE